MATDITPDLPPSKPLRECHTFHVSPDKISQEDFLTINIPIEPFCVPSHLLDNSQHFPIFRTHRHFRASPLRNIRLVQTKGVH